MNTLRQVWLLLLLVGLVLPAQAQQPAPKPPSQDERRAEQVSAWKAASAVMTRGPAVIPLEGGAKLAVPKGMTFIPRREANRLSETMGNSPDSNLVGLVMPLDDAADWIVFINWNAEGYVRDDEAKDLDAETVLQGLRDGTDEGNKDRAARGFPELEVLGWNQPPRYDAATHQLSWSVSLKDKGGADDDRTVNYNTRTLGRDGYFSLNLVTEQASFDRDRPVASTLLGGLNYDEGKPYSDFNSSTDHVAEYGLMALIGVAAAKKLGLLAVLAAFALKFAKVGILAVGGGLLAIKRLFRRRPSA